MSLNDLHDRLIDAIFRGRIRDVNRCLDERAEVNGMTTAEKGWWTPLGQAAEQQNAEIIQLLVARGADVNCRNADGLSPLHFAVDIAIDAAQQAGCKQIDWSQVRLLLSLGANPLIEDNRGETAFQIPHGYGVWAEQQFNQFIKTLSNCF
jgi:hypothetical protein